MLEFGKRVEGVSYIERVCAYAIIPAVKEISGTSNVVALVETRKGILLPGGGDEPGETLEAALHREIVEETGYDSTVADEFGAAVQYQYDEKKGVYFRKTGHFFRASFTKEIAEPEKSHKLIWIAPQDAIKQLAWEFHAWALSQVFSDGSRRP